MIHGRNCWSALYGWGRRCGIGRRGLLSLFTTAMRRSFIFWKLIRGCRWSMGLLRRLRGLIWLSGWLEKQQGDRSGTCPTVLDVLFRFGFMRRILTRTFYLGLGG